ncbi:Fe-S cluster assembly sulfur transfer protein SufU [Rhizomicrobium electricum]|uniref:SUF system NifU family Fe-S cluster assembly protein n=1 Tax=Rhizomicrobium electricum TaxID=480070 RepID=A0ABN1F8I7_9PROT|nr:SUF system NifU family Fe-S cluster assembly protein [Rhizomicrobium electricum]NIJ46785.1 nitrogen fixation NifU-like protein [Rhizomicrobium electricum]
MIDESLRELYQEVILDHSKHPRHFGPLDHATHNADGLNPLCGDRITVHLNLDAEGRIADIAFEGKGCAISQASASLMTDMLKGRSTAEAEKLMNGFLHLVKGEEGVTGLADDDLEILLVMAGVSAFPMRVKCATLAWHTMKSALEGSGAPAKSE